MRKKDFVFIVAVIVVLLPFCLIPELTAYYNQLNKTHGMWMSFAKFAILATLGECIALRIRIGNYNQKGFGIVPRAIVWGFLGLTIKMAFVIFATGTPVFLEYLGIKDSISSMKGSFSGLKLFTAFSISAAMNLIYAPIMMTLHRITDTHIIASGGSVSGFFSPIPFSKIFVNLNWDTLWNFVFKKTIPFFWIPAHTITFLLPENMQILFAAALGIALGIILSLAAIKK